MNIWDINVDGGSMNRSNKIEYLRVLAKAVNQACGNISCEKDLNINRKERKQIGKDLINDENIIRLTKQYVDDNYGRRS